MMLLIMLFAGECGGCVNRIGGGVCVRVCLCGDCVSRVGASYVYLFLSFLLRFLLVGVAVGCSASVSG